jgi:hypothetical protein
MSDPVQAVLEALFAPVAPEQRSTFYEIPNNGRISLPVTITLTNQSLGRLIDLVSGGTHAGFYSPTRPEFPLPEMSAAAPIPDVPQDVIDARLAEAAADAEAWEASGAAEAARAERDARRAEFAAEPVDVQDDDEDE